MYNKGLECCTRYEATVLTQKNKYSVSLSYYRLQFSPFIYTYLNVMDSNSINQYFCLEVWIIKSGHIFWIIFVSEIILSRP
jgi:hypothetical protein